MSIYGYTTKRDLTKLGSFLMMGLFGIIIASLVNIFMKSTMMYFVISIIGVLVFVGLTAYDTQKIKNMYLVSDSGELMGKKATALIAAEAGGINGTLPFIVSAYTGLPVIDADGMGRAFPELQMCTFGVYGVNCSPVIVRDEKDNEMVVDAENNHASEMFARVICMQMGTKSEICLYPMTGKQMKETSVHHTVTLAYEIGKSIGDARVKGTDPLEGIVDYFKNSFDKPYNYSKNT